MLQPFRSMKPLLLRFKRWPALIATVILIASIILWIDSNLNVRHFIFLPGGDVGLGFGSCHGLLQWVEYAPWSPMPQYIYSQVVAVPYCLITVVTAAFLCWCVFSKDRQPKI